MQFRFHSIATVKFTYVASIDGPDLLQSTFPDVGLKLKGHVRETFGGGFQQQVHVQEVWKERRREIMKIAEQWQRAFVAECINLAFGIIALRHYTVTLLSKEFQPIQSRTVRYPRA